MENLIAYYKLVWNPHAPDLHLPRFYVIASLWLYKSITYLRITTVEVIKMWPYIEYYIINIQKLRYFPIADFFIFNVCTYIQLPKNIYLEQFI